MHVIPSGNSTFNFSANTPVHQTMRCQPTLDDQRREPHPPLLLKCCSDLTAIESYGSAVWTDAIHNPVPSRVLSFSLTYVMCTCFNIITDFVFISF